MEAVRENWTDERLDDLRDGVAEFRAEMRDEFAAFRAEMKAEFAAVRKEMRDEFAAVRAEMKDEFRAVRGEMQAGFGDLAERLDRLQQTMIGFCGLMMAALIGLIATQ